MIPLLDQLREAEREMALRRSVYPRWVSERKLSPEKAASQLAKMEAIVTTLRKVYDLEQVSLEILGSTET